MKRIFITGSSDGLGMMASNLLIEQGHKVVLHAKNPSRAEDALKANPNAEAVTVADLSSISETINLAEQVNKLGHFDAIIHNAGIGFNENRKNKTEDGLPHVFAVNSLAPYILTSLIHRPQRLIYTSSVLHRNGDSSLEDLFWEHRTWNGYQAYADSKLHNVLLAFSVANLWKNIYSNALEPGWVATKLGGKNATDSIADAPLTQIWLATSDEAQVLQSGNYYYHKKNKSVHQDARNTDIQNNFIEQCAKISGVKFDF